MKKEIKEHKCEWCGTNYPEFDMTVVFYQVYVFNKLHTICNECYERLRLSFHLGATP